MAEMKGRRGGKLSSREFSYVCALDDAPCTRGRKRGKVDKEGRRILESSEVNADADLTD